jgi:hypothetical protein
LDLKLKKCNGGFQKHYLGYLHLLGHVLDLKSTAMISSNTLNPEKFSNGLNSHLQIKAFKQLLTGKRTIVMLSYTFTPRLADTYMISLLAKRLKKRFYSHQVLNFWFAKLNLIEKEKFTTFGSEKLELVSLKT